jgi:hypothetical protein
LNCSICTRDLNQPMMPDTADCAGHCLRCMADSEDPECIELIEKLENPASRNHEILRYEAWRTQLDPQN